MPVLLELPDPVPAGPFECGVKDPEGDEPLDSAELPAPLRIVAAVALAIDALTLPALGRIATVVPSGA